MLGSRTLAPLAVLLFAASTAAAQAPHGDVNEESAADEPASDDVASDEASDAAATEDARTDDAAPEGGPDIASSSVVGGAASEADAAPDEATPESLDHLYQVGLRLGAGVPFVFALHYNTGSSPPCDAMMSQFCVFIASGVFDGDLSFGVTRDLEITFMGRIGMAAIPPTNQNNVLLGLGIRSYVGPEGIFKGFFGVRAILDLTPGGNGITGWSDVDGGVRGEAGVQVDIVRYVGLYAQIGVNITFVRALAIVPDVTGGVQVRVP